MGTFVWSPLRSAKMTKTSVSRMISVQMDILTTMYRFLSVQKASKEVVVVAEILAEDFSAFRKMVKASICLDHCMELHLLIARNTLMAICTSRILHTNDIETRSKK